MSDCGGWVLIMVQGVEIQIGCDYVVDKICCFVSIYDKVFKDQILNIVWIDLCYFNGFVVVWCELVMFVMVVMVSVVQ